MAARWPSSTTTSTPHDHGPATAARGRSGLWSLGVAAWGLLTALLPHVLHHALPLIGSALLAGALGGVIFGAIGLLAMIPLLLRMRRRFGTWIAPAAAAVLFTVVFVASTALMGPLIRDDRGLTNGADPSPHASGHGH